MQSGLRRQTPDVRVLRACAGGQTLDPFAGEQAELIHFYSTALDLSTPMAGAEDPSVRLERPAGMRGPPYSVLTVRPVELGQPGLVGRHVTLVVATDEDRRLFSKNGHDGEGLGRR